ncbi:hypothetical protein IGI04_029771 [Brassica rapa subsp. trilocularis]|uniref:At2g35280-like TPR domain-containing protein n=1 Tax=Brassica rapa subsp. trilocularis TaxID=1813537 RepID=A0ABQ7LNR1_BRACM|nr:hypothetical protein IGI04_029771 [Brassica rapa subsp. trilocularis]
MDSLPPSMLHKILSTVATMNIRDFGSARIAFPGFNEVGREDHFYRSANPIYLNDWVDEVSAVRTFRLKCYRSGNPEAIYLRGMYEFFILHLVDEGWEKIHLAGERGCELAHWQLSGHWDYDKPGMFLSMAERIDPNVLRDCWCSHIDPPEFEVSLDGSRSRWKCDRCFWNCAAYDFCFQIHLTARTWPIED